MPERRVARLSVAMVRRFLAAAALAAVVLSVSVHARAAGPDAHALQPDAVRADGELPDLRRSVAKALSYQGIVVTTDQLLYWAIITGTTASELQFLTANAVTGIAYYVAFDETWRAAHSGPAAGQGEVSVTKAIAYRAFDTVRVLGVTLAIGTPVSGSLIVTAAIAATRTGIYMLHEYTWSWLGSAHRRLR